MILANKITTSERVPWQGNPTRSLFFKSMAEKYIMCLASWVAYKKGGIPRQLFEMFVEKVFSDPQFPKDDLDSEFKAMILSDGTKDMLDITNEINIFKFSLN